jgi:hypothetical protein
MFHVDLIALEKDQITVLTVQMGMPCRIMAVKVNFKEKHTLKVISLIVVLDVDECSLGSHACKLDTEECINAKGSFECECKEGYTRTDNECIPETETDKEQFDDDPAGKDANSSVEPSGSDIGETLADTEVSNSQDETHSENHEEL